MSFLCGRCRQSRPNENRRREGTDPVRDPYWHDTTATLYAGDARELLAEMPDRSVDCIVTSPPPWRPPHTDDTGQHPEPTGHAPTPALYIAAVRRVFAEAHRVLTDEGTAWLAVGDLYAGKGHPAEQPRGRHARRIAGLDPAMTGLPAASLIGLPWQLAFALRDDGWIIRNAIVWDYSSSDIAPAAGRFASSYELIFLLAKQDRHYFDPDAAFRRQDRLITGPGSSGAGAGFFHRSGRHSGRQLRRHGSSGRTVGSIGNCRGNFGAAPPAQQHGDADPEPGVAADVWLLPARPRRGILPIVVPLRCIAIGCRPGGKVLDPYAGIADTGLAARVLARSYIGVAQTETQCRIAARRLRQNTGRTDDAR